MAINCIIIEDEPLALERTKGFVLKLSFLNLLACFENAIDALVFLKKNKVDLIFLDIQMSELSGIQFLESGQVKSKIIITTAYNQFALKGYDLQVSDYLLKPFTFERFVQAVNHVLSQLSKNENEIEKKFIFVKTEHRLEKVQLEDVLYIEGMRDYRRIHTINKRIMTLQTFIDLEQIIPENTICRVHKSFMVSIDKIESIEKERIKIGEVFIPISETYKKNFYSLINFRG